MDGTPIPGVDARPALAEALGTYLLVFFGAGAILAEARTGALGHLGIALAFAFVVLVVVYALAHVSGAHINPAVTLAFAAAGRFPWRLVPGYLASQAAGATAAAGTLLAVHGPVADLGATTLAPAVSAASGFALETLATFLLVLVIFGVATDPRASPGAAGLAIGLAIGLDALVAGPFTGASMNPARSLGPALVSGQFADLWLYLVAPVVGGVAAAFTYEYLRPGRAPPSPLGVAGPVDLERSS